MTISIIVPVYKVEPYLRRCVDSILAQAYRNLEIILVDDGSPDHCPAICDEYATGDPRVCVIHKENGGLSDARNAGMEAAGGEWSSFVDSDDWIEPDMYQIILGKALQYNAQISVGGMRDEQEEEQRQYHGYRDDFLWRKNRRDTFTSEAMKRIVGSWSAWGRIYQRELFRDVRFPVGEINEDEAIALLLLAQCKRIAYTNKVLYHYIRRPGSIRNFCISEKKLA